MGAGLGVLAIYASPDCDARCNYGGAGAMVSFAARVLFVDRPTFTVGAGARLVVPLQQDEPSLFGYFIGDGKMLLGALEVAFGKN